MRIDWLNETVKNNVKKSKRRPKQASFNAAYEDLVLHSH
ncbi:hypothetical protein GYO_0797 [Bacillus spizizenii TU-B-10]|uniref:Uncharacterized protein n=1 Tax=Bacillus spizizenii (strain DSM 15029 / JCM 12233 / NBRC 101239 / NRRL B-23049 / TU-B-10) TaxID=1052585 RepID=G4NR23_BACS4|nr:hypothetical protein GYO_0797 [Bacillus spizizenii TU-B-10]